MIRRFNQLDVFTNRPLFGNPLAVVVDGEGLDASEMQRFATWMNLSETTFLLPPTNPAADYRVRIFTPGEELPFAGHPTLGSAFAWLANGGTPKQPGLLVQECGVGLVTVRRDGDALAFAAPPMIRSGSVDESLINEAARGLGITRDSIVDAAWVDNGSGFMGLLLNSADEVLAIQPPTTQLKVGIAGPYPANSIFAYEVRAFYSANGTTFEDPVTGSLNASLAQWLIGTGRFSPPYLASQGTAISRAGVVRINADDSGAVWVGGDVVQCVTGTVDI
jgi:PhzF family phenazine biosynthesis protein